VTRSAEQVVQILRQCLDDGSIVEIDGLGVFRRGGGGYEFLPSTRPKIFLAYVQEDAACAERLYEDLRSHGFDPWLDRKKLLPGQNWPRAIQRAIEVSDFFLACLSGKAVQKKGQFQAELRYALDCAATMPLDQVFLVPVRLEPCPVPPRISREFQYVDLFPDWEAGVERVVSAANRLRSGAASLLSGANLRNCS
jgi:hypothetical protein